MIYISKLFSPISTQELQEMLLAAENETKDQNDESEVS